MNQWKDVVVYQIYPKSFHDQNGDGFGDILGIIKKLAYLENLGVDYIWLNPIYLSPQEDNGYDIADYYQIDPMYGTMADMELLIQEAAKRKIKIMLDLAFNHTSTKHEWFQKALQNDAYYKNFYFFKKGKDGLPPTNWQSKFGGSSWEYVEELGEYYLHLFDKTQADLNWDNAEVRQEIYKVVNFWIEKGIKGFRLDVMNLISKPEVFADDDQGDGRRFYTDGPHIHQYLQELHEHTFGKHEDIITVGEMSSTTIEECIRYSNPQEKELSMVFNFHHLKVDYKNGDKWSLMPVAFQELKQLLARWQTEMQKADGWSAVFWCNHDQPRIVSRFGDEGIYRIPAAKMLATAIHMLRGTPYIYQGEEIGMTNANFHQVEDYRDVESLNYYRILADQGLDKESILQILAARSRDNARTPMQWDQSAYAGFSTSKPWISVNSNYRQINVEQALDDPESVYHHYQSLIAFRKKSAIIQEGMFQMILEEHPQVFAYERVAPTGTLLVINNFYPEKTTIVLPKEYNGFACQLWNYASKPISARMELLPFESLVYLKEE